MNYLPMPKQRDRVTLELPEGQDCYGFVCTKATTVHISYLL